MSYLLSHWRGRLSLGISLWVNMIGLLIVISCVELFILAQFAVVPSRLVGITQVSLLITRLIIFPWQLIGLFRAIEHDYIEHKNILKTRCLQAFALLTVLFTLVYSLEVFQGAVFYKSQVEFYSQPKTRAGYRLDLSENKRQLVIHGDLEIGITNAVRLVIEQNPRIASIALQSRGGQIYEGRGLARLFAERELDTYVYEECSSACVTAYIGGKKRYLGVEGKLGFHQYKVETNQYRPLVPFFNTEKEQQRDLELFMSRGVTQAFLDKIFDQPPDKIWYPDHATLRQSNIVHADVPRE